MISAKQYLQQLKRLDTKIDQRLQELAELKARAFGSGGAAPEGDRVQTSLNGDKLAGSVAAYVDLEAEINRMIDDYVDRKHRIIGEIQQLPDDRYVKILFKRYVEDKSFEKIAKELHYSYDHICRLHGNALTEFERCHKMSD